MRPGFLSKWAWRRCGSCLGSLGRQGSFVAKDRGSILSFLPTVLSQLRRGLQVGPNPVKMHVSNGFGGEASRFHAFPWPRLDDRLNLMSFCTKDPRLASNAARVGPGCWDRCTHRQLQGSTASALIELQAFRVTAFTGSSGCTMCMKSATYQVKSRLTMPRLWIMAP